MKNKKGLATDLMLMVFLMFIFSIGSLFALFMWDQFETSIDNIDNETIRPEVKDQISAVGEKLLWGDKLFVFFYFALLLAFIISSRTVPVDSPEYLFVFFILLLIICVIAMFMANTWEYLIEGTFSSVADEVGFTNHFMKFYPIYTLATGLIAAVLFYTRTKGSGAAGVENLE